MQFEANSDAQLARSIYVPDHILSDELRDRIRSVGQGYAMSVNGLFRPTAIPEAEIQSAEAAGRIGSDVAEALRASPDDRTDRLEELNASVEAARDEQEAELARTEIECQRTRLRQDGLAEMLARRGELEAMIERRLETSDQLDRWRRELTVKARVFKLEGHARGQTEMIHRSLARDITSGDPERWTWEIGSSQFTCRLRPSGHFLRIYGLDPETVFDIRGLETWGSALVETGRKLESTDGTAAAEAISAAELTFQLEALNAVIAKDVAGHPVRGDDRAGASAARSAAPRRPHPQTVQRMRKAIDILLDQPDVLGGDKAELNAALQRAGENGNDVVKTLDDHSGYTGAAAGKGNAGRLELYRAWLQAHEAKKVDDIG